MLVAMSRMISKRNPVCRTTVVSFQRRLICLLSLVLAMVVCLPLFSAAQENERSILVFDSSSSSAASNAQVELTTNLPQASLPQASATRPSFPAKPAVAPEHFIPPSPPASLVADSDNTASFRFPKRDAITAAPTPPQPKTQAVAQSIPSSFQDDGSELAKSAAISPANSGTYTSRLQSSSRLQTDNSFGSSPVSSDLRSGGLSEATSASRNRFGDFGESPASKVANRFSPISSAKSSQSSSTPPPVLPARNRFAPPVVPASAEQPIKPKAPSNRFGSPASPSNNRFAQPPQPKASQPNTSGGLLTPQPKAAPLITPPPQGTSQSAFPGTNPQPSNRFPSAPPKFAGIAPTSKAPASSFSTPSQPLTSRSSNSVSSSNSNSATPVIRRQPSSSTSSSFSNLSASSQPSLGNSRSNSQSNRFASQSSQQPLRGRPVTNNDLRGNSSFNQTQPVQRPANTSQSSGKADRNSINFARQQLRNIQPASAGGDGTPVRLVEMLLEPLSGSQRKQMVAQYWETYYDLAALKIAIDHEKWISSLSTTGAEQGLLLAAQQMAADRKLAAEIQLGKSQSRLLDFMPNPRPNGFAPLPADEPLVEHYVTDYEKYKRIRSLPSNMRGIDPMLASTLKLITQRAATVSTAKTAAQQAGQGIRNRQVPLASVIAASKLWRDSQLDMVASTVSYNQAISDFVLTLEPNRSPEQLTAFMLGAPKNGSQSNSINPNNQSLAPQARSASNFQGWPNRQ